MITERTVNIYGIVSVVLMAGMFALMLFKAVPRDWFIPMFIVASILYAGRFILKMMFAKQKRESHDEPELPSPPVE